MPNPDIQVSNLEKTFYLKQKSSGLSGSLKSLWKPKTKKVAAIHDLSFSVYGGEKIAFIGPNGAGKSTTIKILTGILFPSGGEVSVLGFTPWENRKQLSYYTGSVFGQKPQLWYHLPPLDTFNLLSHIYELDHHDYKRQRDFLIDIFQIKHLINTPVRKLSLGQRMKCEIVASFLHKPKILFLDEPTIGLDVVARQQIRQAITFLNESHNATIFLTSHDASDIEKICDRVIIINDGNIVFNNSTLILKKQFLSRKIIEVSFTESVSAPFIFPNVSVIEQQPFKLTVSFDNRVATVESVIQYIMSINSCNDIVVSNTPLEDVIRHIFTSQIDCQASE